jgi:hypothetical protein
MAKTPTRGRSRARGSSAAREIGAPTEPSSQFETAEASGGDPGTEFGGMSHDRIARRAFEIFLRRGGDHGRDVDDWLAAEQELRSAQEP